MNRQHNLVLGVFVLYCQAYDDWHPTLEISAHLRDMGLIFDQNYSSLLNTFSQCYDEGCLQFN